MNPLTFESDEPPLIWSKELVIQKSVTRGVADSVVRETHRKTC